MAYEGDSIDMFRSLLKADAAIDDDTNEAPLLSLMIQDDADKEFFDAILVSPPPPPPSSSTLLLHLHAPRDSRASSDLCHGPRDRPPSLSTRACALWGFGFGVGSTHLSPWPNVLKWTPHPVP